MLDRLMSYGKRDKGFDTALITIIVLAMSLAFIAHSGILQDVPDTEHVVGSEVSPKSPFCSSGWHAC